MRVVHHVQPWRHDLGHCLHAALGSLLGFHGLDPLSVLGPCWGFDYTAGQVRREEYYYPTSTESLLATMAPFHDVDSVWHRPPDPEAAWGEVRQRIAEGDCVGVAADNFYLRFRPAYGDVHSNHLLVVHGFDDRQRLAYVTDPVPPLYQGPIPLDELAAARFSTNPVAGDRDLFFTSNPIVGRWLEVSVGPQQPGLDGPFLRRVVAANLCALGQGDDDEPLRYRGLPGLERFFAERLPRVGEGQAVVDELFIVIGVLLATTGVHGDYLAHAGLASGDIRLIEVARTVDRVAHHWSALRIMTVVAGRDGGAGWARFLDQRMASLLRAYRAVTEAMGEWVSHQDSTTEPCQR